MILAILWAIPAVILAVVGKKNIDEIEGAPQTAETLKQVPEAVTPSKEPR